CGAVFLEPDLSIHHHYNPSTRGQFLGDSPVFLWGAAQDIRKFPTERVSYHGGEECLHLDQRPRAHWADNSQHFVIHPLKFGHRILSHFLVPAEPSERSTKTERHVHPIDQENQQAA